MPVKKKNGIYCGNNAKSKKLTKEKYKIGRSYECLRKGIGVGRNLPLNTDMLGPYKPIKKRTFFCGKKSNWDRQKYDRIGDPTECLRAGIVIGQKLKADEFVSKYKKNKSRRKSKRKSKRRSRKKSRRKSKRR